MRYSLIVLLTLVTGLAQAADKYQDLRQRLAAAFPGAMITSIEETPLPSLLQVELNGVERLYVSPDGCLLYTSPSPRDLSTSRMPSSA